MKLSNALQPWHVHATGAAVCLLLSAASYLTAIRPMTQAQLHSRTQAAMLAEQRREASDLEEKLAALHREMGQVTETLESSDFELLSAGRINQRIAELTELAVASGLKIQRIDPGAKHREPLFETVPIDLGGQATYRDHLLFLRAVHARFPDISVAEFSVASRPGERPDAAQFKLRLCWFTARESVASGK